MTATTPDANDVLMGGGGAPTAKFEHPGTTIGGRIVAPPRAHQEREYDPRNPGQGKVKTFPSGDPIYGLTVDVQTQLRDASIEDDTGIRRIYVEGKRLKEAVRNAVREAGADKLESGGELHVTFTGFGQPAGAGIKPPKEYTARYVPAAQAQLMGGGQGQQPDQFNSPTPAPQWATSEQGAVNTTTGELQQQQAPPASAPAAASGPTPEAIAALRAAGVDPATVYPGFTG